MKKNVWKKRMQALLLVVCLIGGIFLYTKVTISAEVNETEVIVTAIDIPPSTQITEEMLTVHSTASRGIPTNAVLKAEDIIGKWTISGYGMSKNSYIYDDKIVNQEELPNAGILELEENEVALPLLVDLESSLGNSIVPNANVDLYFKSILYQDDSEKALYGRLASQVRVVAIKDSKASNVFATEGKTAKSKEEVTNQEAQSMARIYIFAIPEELGELMNKAKMLGEITPIATGKSNNTDLETIAEESEVVKYIEEATFKVNQEPQANLTEESTSENKN